MSDEEIRVLAPSAMLGYGFSNKWFKKGIDRNPHTIAVDSGSTDSGPHKLGTGAMTCSREAYYKDISLLLAACYDKKIPLFISSAGGAGTNQQVDIFLDIIKDIAKGKGYHFNIAAIYSEIEKELVIKKLKAGQVRPCGCAPPLTEDEVNKASVIVAQMGVEPYLEALRQSNDLDIIISGRTYDPVPIAVLGLKEGFEPGICWHMGKIMECGALCAEPAGKTMLGIMRKDNFILEPMNPDEKCTVYSVAAHTLYEKSHPYLLPGPGGLTDLSDAKFEQLDERRVKVSGSKFISDAKYMVKLEGAKKVGYRTIFIAGVRDPIQIAAIDEIIERVKREVTDYFIDVPPEEYQMIFHLYGKNGVMGDYERQTDHKPLELCIILEVAAATQEMATAICSRARTEMLHSPYKGRIATAGNIALPFTPLEIPLGDVCEFNIYHLMELDQPLEPFPIKFLEV
ncbi:MAG: acyclic terpene utilization AtuA family protein [bacterium]